MLSLDEKNHSIGKPPFLNFQAQMTSKNCNLCIKTLPHHHSNPDLYHTHTPPPTPPTTHTTPIPDHLHEIMMRGGGQVWVWWKTLCFQGVRWCLKKCGFIPEFIGKRSIFFHKAGLQTWNKSSL